MNISAIKKATHTHLQEEIERKIQTAKEEIESARSSIIEDNKSSAGDKYETNREMMQAEISRNEMNLSKAQVLYNILKRIRIGTSHQQVVLGSIVETNKGLYFISIGVGIVNLDNQKIFCISEASPIGELLIGKKVGESIDFRGQKIDITSID